MKTERQKKIQGTLRPCRVKTMMTFDPLTSIPKPMTQLPSEAGQYYMRVCECLLSRESLTMGDVPAITRAGMNYEIFMQACRDCLEKGYSQVTPGGYSSKAAWFLTMMEAEKALANFERQYGLSLASRSKMDLPKPAEKNCFDDF